MLTQTFPVKPILGLSFMAAGIATLCDVNHVYTGALSYTYPQFMGQAWWVFFNFWQAFFMMICVYYILTGSLAKKKWITLSVSKDVMAPFIDAILFFIVAYLLTGFAQNSPLLLSGILYGTYLVRLASSYEKLFILGFGLAMAMGGIFVEGSLSALGQMQYAHPAIYNVPLWLGGLYLHGSFALRSGARAFLPPRL